MHGLSDFFPFWTDRQVSHIVKSLIKQGVIISGNYNRHSYDRTLWYAFKNEWENAENGIISHLTKVVNGEAKSGDTRIINHLTKVVNAKAKSVEPIPITNTITNTLSIKENTKEKIEPQKISKKKTLVNENFWPDEKTVAWFNEKQFTFLLPEMVEIYIDGCHAKETKYINHNAAFKTWSKNQQEWSAKNETHTRTKKLTAFEQVEQAIKDRNSIIELKPHRQVMGENGEDLWS